MLTRLRLPRVDVLLAGHAYAPGATAVESLAARLHVGSLAKELTITGDRAWAPGPRGARPGPTTPFRRMALRYERGGLAGENSIGVDEGAHGVEVGRPLPNIAATGGHTPGFGPVPLLWRARRRNLPDAAVLWAYRARLGAGTMPQGFDFSLFNAAPAEQQIAALPLRAPIVLENLSPHLPRLESRLPALAPKLFRIQRETGRASSVALRADTLWIDADRALVVVSWRGLTPVAGPSDAEIGQLIVAIESDGERVRTEAIERLALTAASHRGPPTLAVVPLAEVVKAAAAPSVAPPAPPSTPQVEPTYAPVIVDPPTLPDPPTFSDPDVTQAVRAGAPQRGALPFRADGTGTATATAPHRVSASELLLLQALPFKPSAPAPPPSSPGSSPSAPIPAPPASSPSSEGPPAFFDEDATQPINLKALNISALLSTRALPGEPASLARPSTMLVAPERTAVVPPPPPLGASLFHEPTSDEPTAPAEPPPMLGAPLFDASAPGASESPSAGGASAEPRSPAALEPDGVAIDQCAAIAAEIAEKRAPRDEVLAARGLTSEAWSAIEERWASEIAAEAKLRTSKLTDAYDAAYVAAIESFRGPVTAEEYGSLLHAMKAGKVNQSLDDLHIQRAAMPRLMRVWSKRMAEDPQLLRKVQGAR